jgi:aryl-alcohol dehydrogenase-like predicted oxidoreductase
MNKIIIGTWPLSGDYGRVSLKSIEDILHKSVESNFFHFDTAPSYGNGFSEFILGKFFAEDDNVLIDTKIGNTPFYGKSFDLDNVKRSFDQSLVRLNRNSINTLYLHNPRISESQYNELINYALSLKKDKVINNIGISLAKDMDYSSHLLDKFDVIQDDLNLLTLSLLNRKVSGGTSLVARSPLASGILSGKITNKTIFSVDDHRSSWLKEERLNSILKRINIIQKEFPDISLIDLAMQFVLCNKKVDKVIFGVKSPNHVTVLRKVLGISKISDNSGRIEHLVNDDFGLINEKHLTY